MARPSFHAISGVTGLVIAVGEGGRILQWTGDRYEPREVTSPTTCDLSAVWIESPESAWAVGDAGTVLRWDGHAQVWLPVALASRRQELHTVWGYPEGGIWIGGRRCLIQYQPGNGGSTLTHTELTVVSVWGSGPDDIWFLCSGRTVLHWNGTSCQIMELPGEDDDEFYAIAGSAPDEDIWIAGLSGLLLRGDWEGWNVVDSGTEATLSGVCALGPDEVWTTTNAGQLRRWNGSRWSVEAFSAFGYLSGLCHVDGVIWAVGAGGVVLQHLPDNGDSKE